MNDYTTVFRLYIVTTILERPADGSGGYCVLGVKKWFTYFTAPATEQGKIKADVEIPACALNVLEGCTLNMPYCSKEM